MTTARRLGLLLLLIACAPLIMALSGGPVGVAFQDLNANGVQDPDEPGLIGLEIHVFDTASQALVQSLFTIASNPGPPPTGDGFYSFTLDSGNYTICAALREGWTQTAPLFAPPPPDATLADCTTYSSGSPSELVPRGYDVRIIGTEVHSDLDFGLAPELKLWLGLKSSDDQGTKFDVKVELLKNGSLVASDLRRCVTGLTRNPKLAKGMRIASFDHVPFAPIDLLELRVSTRIGTDPLGAKCVPGHNSARGLRLYYDAGSRPSGFEATLAPGSHQSFYLDSNGTACPAGGSDSANVTDRTLTGTDPTARDAKCKDSSNIRFTGGNPFSEVGTWILP